MRGHERAIVTMFSIAVCLAAAVPSVRDLRRDPGWHDFRAMCGAVDLLTRGSADIVYGGRATHPGPLVTYPPLAIEPLRPLCGDEAAQRLAWGIAIAVAAVSLTFAFRGQPAMLIVALTLTGFRAVTWILWTGNIAAVDFLLVALAALAASKQREAAAGTLLGAAGFVRIFPLLFIPAFAVGIGRRRAASLVISGVGAFVALHLVSMAVMPRGSAEYWSAVVGGFGGLLRREMWFGSTTHPAMSSAALAIGRMLPHTTIVAAVAYAIAATALVGAFGVVWRSTTRANVPVDLRWGGVVLVLLLSPRLKPYNLALALPSLCFAASKLGGPRQVLVLIAWSAIPFAVFEITGVNGRAFALGYTQLVLLAALYVVLLGQALFPGSRGSSSVLFSLPGALRKRRITARENATCAADVSLLSRHAPRWWPYCRLPFVHRTGEVRAGCSTSRCAAACAQRLRRPAIASLPIAASSSSK